MKQQLTGRLANGALPFTVGGVLLLALLAVLAVWGAQGGVAEAQTVKCCVHVENPTGTFPQDFTTTTLTEAGNEDPYGIWSDGTTMWVVDLDDAKIYAYHMSTKLRDEGKDFETLDAAGNDDPTGLWSDGTTMWVADAEDNEIYAYNILTKVEDTSKGFDTTRSYNGIWSDGTTIWGVNRPNLWAHVLSTGAIDTAKDIVLNNTYSPGPRGTWSNGTTIWVADSNTRVLSPYTLSSGALDPSELFNNLSSTGGGHPRGLWSDGTTMWITATPTGILAYAPFPGVTPPPTPVPPTPTPPPPPAFTITDITYNSTTVTLLPAGLPLPDGTTTRTGYRLGLTAAGSSRTTWDTNTGVTVELLNLLPSTDYTFDAQSLVGAQAGTRRFTAFTTLATPPLPTLPTPKGLTFADILLTTATVDWDDVPGAQTYRWTLTPGGLTQIVSNSGIHLTALTRGTAYTFDVVAVPPDTTTHNESLPATGTFATPADLPLPTPGNLRQVGMGTLTLLPQTGASYPVRPWYFAADPVADAESYTFTLRYSYDSARVSPSGRLSQRRTNVIVVPQTMLTPVFSEFNTISMPADSGNPGDFGRTRYTNLQIISISVQADSTEPQASISPASTVLLTVATGTEMALPVLTEVSVTHDTATITWPAVPNATGYNILEHVNETGIVRLVANQTAPTWTATGLTPNLDHVLRVQAVTTDPVYRSSLFSEAFTVTTDSVPLAAPVLTVDAGATVASVSWPAIPNASGARWSLAPASTTGLVNGNNIVFTGLDTSVDYVVTVIAISTDTRFADSDPAMASFTTMISAPGSLTLAPAANSIVASWSSQPGVVFTLQYGLASSDIWIPVNNISTTTHTITGLSDNVAYDVRVRAVSGASISAWSAIATTTTPPAVPLALRATVTANTLDVAWDPGLGAATYDLRYRSGGTGIWTPVNNIAITQHALRGLVYGTSYEIQVRSVAVGISAWSASITAVTASPATPTGLTLSGGGNIIAAVWNPQSDATSFSVRHRIVTAPTWVTQSDIQQPRFTFSNLVPGTSYEVQVSAQAGTGTSAWTASMNRTTDQLLPPGVPTALTASTDGGALRTRWVAPAGTPGAVAYDLQYRLAGAGDPWVIQSGLTDVVFAIRGLDFGATYEIQVRSVGVQGAVSAWTASTLAQTSSPFCIPSQQGRIFDAVWTLGTSFTFLDINYRPLAISRVGGIPSLSLTPPPSAWVVYSVDGFVVDCTSTTVQGSVINFPIQGAADHDFGADLQVVIYVRADVEPPAPPLPGPVGGIRGESLAETMCFAPQLTGAPCVATMIFLPMLMAAFFVLLLTKNAFFAILAGVAVLGIMSALLGVGVWLAVAVTASAIGGGILVVAVRRGS